jgi:hypothetical protein
MLGTKLVFGLDITTEGIIASNRLIGFTTIYSRNPIPDGITSIAWEKQKVRSYNIIDLVSIIKNCFK